MEHSDKLDKIGAALIEIQGDVSGVEKTSPGQVGQQKYLYADLAATNAATRNYLVAAGVLVTQWPGPYSAEARTMEMTTMLLHAESGQWMKGTLSIPLGKVDAQGYGSCLTYARRYALQAVLNLSPEDDDGEGASQQTAAAQTSAPTKADSRDVYDRLSKANRSITTLEAFDFFWEKESVQAAAKSLPASWAKTLKQEKADKFAELDERKAAMDDQFPGDMPFESQEPTQ